MRNAMVVTNGCPENRLDCAETEQLLVQNDWRMTSVVDQAELIILNLCGLVDGTEQHSLALIDEANKKKKTDAILLVTGCLPKINLPSINKIFSGPVIKGHDNAKVASLLGLKDSSATDSANYLIPEKRLAINHFRSLGRKMKIGHVWKKIKSGIDPYTFLHRDEYAAYQRYYQKINIVQPDTCYIKVSSGCRHACSYCAVKISRGSVKSKSIDTIKTEFLRGLNSGFHQFALIGTDLGSYGKDTRCDLAILLRELVAIDGHYSIKLRNVHPQFLIEHRSELIDILNSGKITHITTAIQHGNDRILDLMKRSYTIKDCLSTINALKHTPTKPSIRTQLIVGFPGESESEFNDTLNLIEACNADFFEVFGYSPRIGTLAAKMPNRISNQTIYRRKYLAVKRVLEVANRDAICPLGQEEPESFNSVANSFS